jgi:hypothetical protein
MAAQCRRVALLHADREGQLDLRGPSVHRARRQHSNDGDAVVKIDLTSISSGIDVRDVRMRFLLFETYRFPNAEVSARLDMASLRALLTSTRIIYPLKFKLSLHGLSQEIETPVTVTRLGDKAVSVASAKPIVITADAFGLGPGLAKLSEAVNGTVIATGATFTFDLLFETGDKSPSLQAAREETAKQKVQAETSAISAEACETRFSVISTAGAIYFKTGSALARQGERAHAPKRGRHREPLPDGTDRSHRPHRFGRRQRSQSAAVGATGSHRSRLSRAAWRGDRAGRGGGLRRYPADRAERLRRQARKEPAHRVQGCGPLRR